MTDLIDRIRAYVAAIPTHRCDGCELDFTSETMTCPSCGIADRTRWIADSDANRLLREVAALEPVSWQYRTDINLDGHYDEWRAICEDEYDFRIETLKGRDSCSMAGTFGSTQNPLREDEFGWPEQVRALYTLTGATHD